MTYVEDICLALIRVFIEPYSIGTPQLLAGYAANARFWAAEVRHALDCIAGYESRFAALKAARIEYAAAQQVELDPKSIEPSISRTIWGNCVND